MIFKGKANRIGALFTDRLLGYALYNAEGTLLYWSVYNDSKQSLWPKVELGDNVFESDIPTRFLNEGSYRIEIFQAFYCKYGVIEPGNNSPSISFSIKGGLSDSPYWISKRPGLLAPVMKWQINKEFS